MKTRLAVMGLLVWQIANPVLAADLQVADNSSSGIYAQMFKEMSEECGSVVQMTELKDQDGGAIGNFTRLIGNEANIGFMHSDVLFYESKTNDDANNLKTLLALFPEDVNIVALSKPYKKPGITGMVTSGKSIDSLSDLAGFNVGAAGGGYITANIIRLQAEIPYNVIRYDDGKQVMAALNRGDIAAGIFVGAAPLPNLKDLGPDYRIVEVGESAADKLKSVYRRTTVTYPKMSPTPVSTIAPDCLLVTRDYHTAKYSSALLGLRQCVYRNLGELQETVGFHKAWQKVDAHNKGKWPGWYEGTRGN